MKNFIKEEKLAIHYNEMSKIELKEEAEMLAGIMFMAFLKAEESMSSIEGCFKMANYFARMGGILRASEKKEDDK